MWLRRCCNARLSRAVASASASNVDTQGPCGAKLHRGDRLIYPNRNRSPERASPPRSAFPASAGTAEWWVRAGAESQPRSMKG